MANQWRQLWQRALIAAILVLAAASGAGDAFAQGETLPKNHALVSVFYVRSETENRFDFLGDRARVIPPAGLDFRGVSRTEILSTDIAYGVTNRLEAHITIPYARTRLSSLDSSGKVANNPDQSPGASGLSNIRFGARYNFVSEPFFLTARFDVKLPAETPNVEKLFNGTSLPVDEGQTDFDIAGQLSRRFSVGDRSLSIGGEAGVRIRLTQKKGALDTFTGETLPVKPANEFIYNFRVTYGLLRRLSLTAAGDGIEEGDFAVPFRFTRVGENGELKTVGTQGALPPGFKPDFEKQTGRRIFSLGPLATLTITPKTTITGGVLFTVAGRNYPAGQFLVIGVSRFF